MIQGRNLATSLMVDTILEQWETVIQPLDVQGLVADDMEMGTFALSIWMQVPLK